MCPGEGQGEGALASAAGRGGAERGGPAGAARSRKDQQGTVASSDLRRASGCPHHVRGNGIPSGGRLDRPPSPHSPARCCPLSGPCPFLQNTASKQLPSGPAASAHRGELLPTGLSSVTPVDSAGRSGRTCWAACSNPDLQGGAIPGRRARR